MDKPIEITIDNNGDGTFTVRQDGEAAVKIFIAPTGRRLGALSIDVKPLHASVVQAIVFGADPVIPEEGRVDRLRFDTGEPNQQLREGAMPFVCADFTPKKG